jgi:polyphenol oxidase
VHAVRRLVTDRSFGALAGDVPDVVTANRQALLLLTGAADIAFMKQVHGDGVALVIDATEVPEVDALVTNRPGVALAVLVADCVPVLLADPEAGVVAAAHAGREGVRLGVVDRTLDAMERLGADPGRVEVWLGPAVCGLCYEVPAALRDLVEGAAPGAAATSRQGTPSLDLRAGLAHHLEGRVARVHLDSRCTVEDVELFSYRQDATTRRQASVIWLEP